ncbi:MAG: acetophenone carboxylase [Chloroflexota bacterium]|nr:MAG: acetophenone carboxylase [Chloroflexota bacterium]
MGVRHQITEYLDVDLEKEVWCCRRCGRELISARENYKRGCLICERDPGEVHRPMLPGAYTMAPDPEWCRLVEFYCPGCGVMVENEYLPPGHPLTRDIELDIDALKAKHGARS